MAAECGRTAKVSADRCGVATAGGDQNLFEQRNQTAEILGNPHGLPVDIRPGLTENDRSATGYLQKDAFEAMADQFFAHPNVSVQGWERAADAQRRIVTALTALAKEVPMGPLVVTGHGGVGTLFLCHAAGKPINRHYDQPAGGGNFLAADYQISAAGVSWKLITPWQPMENFATTYAALL